MNIEMTNVAILLAHEGVPVGAIARAMQRTPEVIRDLLDIAAEDGKIVIPPATDWPKGTARAPTRAPVTEDEVIRACVTTFGLTLTEARTFVPILARKTIISREAILRSINNLRPEADECDMKMVDVMIHHTRKKLKKHDIGITTVWSQGYQMYDADRVKAFDLLAGKLGTTFSSENSA